MDRTKIFHSSKAVSVSPHSGADGLVQGELPPFFFSLNVDRFHQPCLLPLAHFFLPPLTADCWAGIGWGLSSPYHVTTTYPCGELGSSSFATNWRFLPRLTRRYHGRTFIRPFAPACVTPAGPPQPGSYVLTIAFHTKSSHQTRYLEYVADTLR